MNERLLITVNHKQVVVQIPEILYAEIIGRKIILHLTDRDIEYYERIGSLEQQLGSGFFRCHRSFLVNLRYLERIEENDLILRQNALRVPVSRNAKRKLKEQLKSSSGN